MTTFTFDPVTYPQRVVLAGLGGTGAALARALARTVYHLDRLGLHTPTLCFVDPDVVEAQNVGRQLFTPADVGQPKAAVLARRFSFALGLAVEWHAEPFDAKRHATFHSLVIGAVDNHRARRELAQTDAVWIDCGNHHNAGQVVVGNTRDPRPILDTLYEHDRDPDDRTIRYLPNAALLFPELLEPEIAPPVVAVPEPNGNGRGSCAHLVAQGEQHLLVNDLVATVTAQYAYRLLLRQPVETFVTFVDADGLTMRSLPICADELLPYLERT